MAKLSPENRVQVWIQVYVKHWNNSITPATYNVTAWSRWQIHKCVGSGLCCSEKFWKFLTRKEPKPITAVLPVSWAQHTGKFFNQTSSTDGKCTLRRCAFWRSLNNLKRRVPNPKKFRVPETDFIHSSDVEIRWIHLWNYFWNPSKSGGTRKLHVWAVPGQTKTTSLSPKNSF